jgi:hypothetical protein
MTQPDRYEDPREPDPGLSGSEGYDGSEEEEGDDE